MLLEIHFRQLKFTFGSANTDGTLFLGAPGDRTTIKHKDIGSDGTTSVEASCPVRVAKAKEGIC